MRAIENTGNAISTWPAEYIICVQGQIDPSWFGGHDTMALSYTTTGNSLLTGQVLDSAALHSLINRLFNLNLVLLLVKRIQEKQPEEFFPYKSVNS